MTKYEWLRWLTFPIMPVHLNKVRTDLQRLVNTHNTSDKPYNILDVGGRKSPYTINLAANIDLLDVPPQNETQESLNLGFTKAILENIKSNRSNINHLIIEDMTKSTLASESYNAVVCVEVIEHVYEDELFAKNIANVLKPNGWAYFTTPNGDFIKNEGPGKNPDHIRHYTKQQLQELLEKHFRQVDIYYAVKTGKYRVQGLSAFKLNKPIRTLVSIYSNLVNRLQSRRVSDESNYTAHLIAIAYN